MDMSFTSERQAEHVDRLRLRLSSRLKGGDTLANLAFGINKEEADCCLKEEQDNLVLTMDLLLNYERVPGWLQFNEFIHSGYRPPGLTLNEIWRSLFKIHNETGNCWTHLLGFLFFFIWGGYTFIFQLWNEPLACRFFFFVFWVSLEWCMVSSTGYHLFSCHSHGTMLCVSRLDYTGISGLILGSSVPAIFYAFYCHPMWQIVYLASVAILGFTTIIGSFFEFFHADSFDTIRKCLFASTAAIGVIPVTHSIFIQQIEEIKEMIDVALVGQNGIFLRLGIMFALYTLGFIIYITKFPECLFPGKFDLWFNSHQFWHILVFAAALVHSCNLLNIYHRWTALGGTCPIDVPFICFIPWLMVALEHMFHRILTCTN